MATTFKCTRCGMRDIVEEKCLLIVDGEKQGVCTECFDQK